MDVIIGNLPDRVGPAELGRLLRVFDQNVRLVFHERQLKGGRKVRYGIGTFSSVRLARKAIRMLDGDCLFGCVLQVREYVYRNYCNERRALAWRNRRWQGAERRAAERRRGTTLAEMEPAALFPDEAVVAGVGHERIIIEPYRNLAVKPA